MGERFSDEVIESVKNINIIDLAKDLELDLVRSSGDRFIAHCFMHSENTPSLTFFENTNSYWCFGCLQGGNSIDLYKAMRGVPFGVAIKELAHKEGIAVEADGTSAGGFEWKDKNKKASTTDFDEVFMYLTTHIRVALETIRAKYGEDSQEFTTYFNKAEEIYERFDSASIDIIKPRLMASANTLLAEMKRKVTC